MNKARNKVLVEKYLTEHPDDFDYFEKEYLLWYSQTDEEKREVPYFVLELYDYLGILPNKHNVYQSFFELLQKQKEITNKKIIEVGGGILPRLGERISLAQKTGSLTIYDPRLSRGIKSTSSFCLKRKKFTSQSSNNNYDLLIGLKPGEATEEMIRWSLANKTDFLIGLCEGGIHGEPYDFYDNIDEWINAMIYLAYRGVEKENMGELKIKKIENCNYPYPIIYNER